MAPILKYYNSPQKNISKYWIDFEVKVEDSDLNLFLFFLPFRVNNLYLPFHRQLFLQINLVNIHNNHNNNNNNFKSIQLISPFSLTIGVNLTLILFKFPVKIRDEIDSYVTMRKKNFVRFQKIKNPSIHQNSVFILFAFLPFLYGFSCSVTTATVATDWRQCYKRNFVLKRLN